MYRETSRRKGKPCERTDATLPGLPAMIPSTWGGGAFAIMLDDGEINVGEAETWTDQTEEILPLQRMLW